SGCSGARSDLSGHSRLWVGFYLPPFALFHTPATDDLRHTPVLRAVPKSPQVIPKLDVEPHACKIVLSLSDREYLETERPRPIDHLPIGRTQVLPRTTADTTLKTPRSVGLSSEVEQRLVVILQVLLVSFRTALIADLVSLLVQGIAGSPVL